MRTILASNSKSSGTQSSSNLSVIPEDIIVKSAPLLPVIQSEDAVVKVQISAPSYLNSLKGNDAPPFRKPGKEPKRTIKTGTLIDEADVIEMIAETKGERGDALKKYIRLLLVDKKITTNYDLQEINFLVILLAETIDYVAQRDFDAHKLAALLTIYLDTHIYFKWFYWQSPAAVWEYFKEVMIRHTIMDSPDGEEVFQPEECYDIISHFHSVYLTNLPLVHILTFGCHRLKFLWPFKPK